MNNDSMRLVLAGGMIGLLMLSAAAWYAVRGPAPRAAAAARAETAVPAAASGSRSGEAGAAETGAAFGEDAAPIFAEDGQAGENSAAELDDPAAGPFTVALRVPEAIRGEKLFVCDETGSPLEEILPDRDGDQTLGPLAPGRYRVFRGETEIGAFRLRTNAALDGTEGRLWTDGELLYVERFVPGTARLLLTLPKPGYYSFRLCDPVGRTWNRDLYIPEGEHPNAGRSYARPLEFRGLPPGAYTFVYRSTPLGQLEVRAEETTEIAFTIDN